MAVVLFGSMALSADDTGWRQSGVRVWYVGMTASYSGQGDAEEANLIESAEGGGFRVVKHSAVAFWNSPLPTSVLPAPNPTSEGPFWISPQRLKALHPPDAFSWQGLSLVVKARVTYQHADDLPFIAYLPVQALYQAQSPRELVTLTGENDGVVGDYFFDVETGLGLSSTLATPGFYMMMMLSEINYDFATHQAFAEDNGVHSAYRLGQMAGRMEWPINQFFLFEERVVSRYKQSVRTDLTLSLHNIASGQSFTGDYTSWFDGANRQFWITPIGVTGSFEATATMTTNGTHGFFWIPSGELGRDAIRVWGLDLTRRDPVGTDSVFASDQLPANGADNWGFTRLQLDPDGFVRELTVQSPWMSFNVDSSTALAMTKTNYITGRSYYLGTMGPATPGGGGASGQRDFGVMAMKVPKKITLSGTPVMKTVTVSLQNHGALAETIQNPATLAQLITLTVNSLGSCPNPTATILAPTSFPITVAPKGKLTVVFSVTYDCVNDSAASSKTEAHWDYSYTAAVDGKMLGWSVDADAHDNNCPHDSPVGGIDPVNEKVRDKGCGGKKPDKTLGADLYTDVTVK